MSILKDRAFAKLFGTIPPANVPIGSYLSWASRDVMTVLAAFILPPVIAKIITDKYGI
jgi:hypothetical protein